MVDFSKKLAGGMARDPLVKFRAALQKSGNLQVPLKTAADLSAVMTLLRDQVPDLCDIGRLDAVFELVETFSDSHPVDPFGGNDAPFSKEILNINLAATAFYLVGRWKLTETGAAKNVAKWVAPFGGPRHTTIINWIPEHSQMTAERLPRLRDTLEKLSQFCSRMDDTAADKHLKTSVQRMAKRLVQPKK